MRPSPSNLSSARKSAVREGRQWNEEERYCIRHFWGGCGTAEARREWVQRKSGRWQQRNMQFQSSQYPWNKGRVSGCGASETSKWARAGVWERVAASLSPPLLDCGPWMSESLTFEDQDSDPWSKWPHRILCRTACQINAILFCHSMLDLQICSILDWQQRHERVLEGKES